MNTRLTYDYISTFTEQHTGKFLLACLKFAHKWSFAPQKSYIRNQLKTIGTPAEQIVAGRMLADTTPIETGPTKSNTNTIPDPEIKSDYFVQPFVDLCKEPITSSQADLLSKEDLILYAQILHHLRFLDKYNLPIGGYVVPYFLRPLSFFTFTFFLHGRC